MQHLSCNLEDFSPVRSGDTSGHPGNCRCILIMQPKLLLFQKCKRMTTSVSTGNASCSAANDRDKLPAWKTCVCVFPLQLSLLLPSFASLTLWLLTYPPPTADRTKIRGPPTQPTAASPSPTSPPATLHVGHSNSGDLITDKQLLFRPAFIHNSPENVTWKLTSNWLHVIFQLFLLSLGCRHAWRYSGVSGLVSDSCGCAVQTQTHQDTRWGHKPYKYTDTYFSYVFAKLLSLSLILFFISQWFNYG